TAYDIELETIQKDISELTPRESGGSGGLDKKTRLVYRLYHRATLTGRDADFNVAERALNDVLREAGPSDELCLLKANLDFTFHRLADTKRDLEMVPGLSGSFAGRSLKADLDLQEGRYDAARTG